MGNDKQTQTEDLKKLEDEAYYELCQIIAEAMQYQDVGLLDSRIAAWKNKYKKLLDNSPSNSNFKKRVEFLLTQYYSEITQYILKQLSLKEEKKVENQAKALRQLYSIIKDTNDYDLLKKKVEKWKEKYPVSSFLKMYQKRIELYTRDKNLKENAFEQEKAFSDLVDITKIHGTLDELKNELALWEEKYSINNKYSIDDFLKHQTEVKRYTSDEFLQSIAREEIDCTDKNDVDIVEQYNNKSCSTLSMQAAAYSTLLSISSKANNVNDLFNWVYKNRYMKFNDKYKELILNATYMNYRPEYLKHLSIPNIDILNTSLSLDEYKNIDEIKRYAIISYFNLLLPPDKAMANNYFNKHIQTIHSKSQKAKNSIDLKDESVSLKDTIIAETEFSNDFENTLDSKEKPLDEKTVMSEIPVEEAEDVPEIIIDISDIESGLTINLEDIEKDTNFKIGVEDFYESTDVIEETKNNETADLIDDKQKEPVVKKPIVEEPINEESNSNFLVNNSKQEKEDVEIIENISVPIEEPSGEEPIVQMNEEETQEETLNYETIVALSPIFIQTINNLNKQSVLIGHIDSTTNEYLESEKTNDISLNEPIKTINDEE